MYRYVKCISLGAIFLLTACEGAHPAAFDPETRTLAATERAGIPSSRAVTSIPSEKADEVPVSTEAALRKVDNAMPVFVELNQTIDMLDEPVGKPLTLVGTAQYTYRPDSRTLLVSSQAPEIAATTELVIGLTTIFKTPDRSYESREIILFPSQPSAIPRIEAFEAATGTVRFFYDGAAHTLAPGMSLTFKQSGGAGGMANVVTIIADYGRVEGIQLLPPDGSLR